MSKKLDIHPAAAIFPMLSDAELKEMATSIQAFGLREKIGVIESDEPDTWLVLDGRNRLSALRLLNVKDDVIVNEFTHHIELGAMNASPEEYVLMANIERRNLGADQRRKLAGKLAVMLAERQKDLPKSQQVDTLAEAAKKAGVSRRTAATAKQEVLEMAASHSENEANKPTQTKKATPKKKGPKRPPANDVVVLEEMITDLNSFGHNFKIDELQAIIGKATTLIDVAESKFESVAKKAAEEASKLAEEANKALAGAKAKRS